MPSVVHALVTPDYGVSTIDVYRTIGGRWTAAPRAGGPSPRTADANTRKREADIIRAWIQTSIATTWGAAVKNPVNVQPA